MYTHRERERERERETDRQTDRERSDADRREDSSRCASKSWQVSAQGVKLSGW